MMPRLLALDPSFRNTGWVLFEITSKGELPIGCGVIHTERADKKLKAYAGDDNHRCAAELTLGLDKVIKEGRPALIVAEAQAGSQNSRAAQLMGMGWGIVSAVTAMNKLIVLQARPTEVKVANCGQAKASKEEVQAAVKERYPSLWDMVRELVPKESAHEHVWDAASVAVACLEATEVKMLRQLGGT